MQPMQPAQQGRPALRYGLIFGAIIAVLVIINSFLPAQVSASGAPDIARGGLGCLFFLVYLALFFVAGMLAARRTGKAGTGSLAGLLAGAIGIILFVVLGVIAILNTPDSVWQKALDQARAQNPSVNLTLQQMKTTAEVFAIVAFVLIYLAAIGVGAGLGALGGLVGRGQAPRPQYPEAMYQGMPQPGYSQPGAYPPPPGYPMPQGTYPQPGYPPAGQPGYPPAGQPEYPQGQYPPPPPPPATQP